MLMDTAHTVTLPLSFVGLNMSMDRTVWSEGHILDFYSDDAWFKAQAILAEDFYDFSQSL
jgi:hypothetical protein